MGGACIAYCWRGEVCAWFWWGNLRERYYWGDPDVRWEDNIKADLQEVRCEGVDWIELAQGRETAALVNAVMNLRVA
jgi:hypothetical protein